MRFVVITLPPEPLCRQIDALRVPLNHEVGSFQALRYPPHLTLRTGLVCPDERATALAEAFLKHASGLEAVPVRTQGLFFTTYGPPGDVKTMVGWSLPISTELLGLHQGLLAFREGAKGPQGDYQPHLTLAFDDLTPAGLVAIRRLLDQGPPVPDFSWTIDHVALFYECTEGWVEWARAPLRSILAR